MPSGVLRLGSQVRQEERAEYTAVLLEKLPAGVAAAIRITHVSLSHFWCRYNPYTQEETMRHSYRPAIRPQPQPYPTQVLDHLGRVAGMFEERGITEVIDQATQQDPEMQIVTAGHAVKAMVLNGLGFLNQQLSLVPHFFQNKPSARLIAPGIAGRHRNADPLGRTLKTFDEGWA